MGYSQYLDGIIFNGDVAAITFDPGDGLFQQTMKISRIISHGRKGYHRSPPGIMAVNLSNRNIELSGQAT
jgi:hypothetical protein